MTVAEAQRKWPLGVAVGKLNVVFAEKEPCLVLDSTVCQVNTRCYLPERLSLPMASDLAYWWQRTGAFLLRQVHLLAWQPRKAFLFVDYLLCALKRQRCSPWWLYSSVLQAPISLEKGTVPSVVRLGDKLRPRYHPTHADQAGQARGTHRGPPGKRKVLRKNAGAIAHLGHQHSSAFAILDGAAVRRPS